MQEAIVTAYTGEQGLSSEAVRPIEKFLNEQNDPTELISFQPLRQADLYAIVARQAVGESVKLRILLREWGVVNEPYLAYYGMVDLEEIGKWKEFGQSLYHRNLRGFKGRPMLTKASLRRRALLSASALAILVHGGFLLLLQPDLSIGRGLPPLQFQQLFGHCL